MSSTTTAMILSLCGDPSDYDSTRYLAKLAGINARENESGEFKGGRGITRRENPVLRTITFHAAISLGKQNAEFKARLEHLMMHRANPLCRRQAYVAMVSKMLRILHTIWKNSGPYDPEIAMGRKLPGLFAARHKSRPDPRGETSP